MSRIEIDEMKPRFTVESVVPFHPISSHPRPLIRMAPPGRQTFDDIGADSGALLHSSQWLWAAHESSHEARLFLNPKPAGS